MSSFKRLANLAKGKILELQGTLNSDTHQVSALENQDLKPREDPSDPRELLEKLRSAGLLTDEEYREKSASLDRPTSRRPKKRTL